MAKMTDEERQKMKLWVETWKRAGPELERFRRQELRAFNYEKSMHIVDGLLEMGARFARPRPTSGLVEQQRLFQKAKR